MIGEGREGGREGRGGGNMCDTFMIGEGREGEGRKGRWEGR